MQPQMVGVEKIGPLRLVKAVTEIDGCSVEEDTRFEDMDNYEKMDFINEKVRAGLMAMNQARELYGIDPVVDVYPLELTTFDRRFMQIREFSSKRLCGIDKAKEV